jgi:shikimate dehydrogenase
MDVTAGPPRSPPLSAGTTVVGVIGDPVAHSLSPLLHNTAFAVMGLDWVSVGFPVHAGRAAEALAGARALGVRGLSVTMPHKEAAAELVGARSPLAQRLGAVNCVVRTDDGWLGDNTDGPGFVASLRRNGHDPQGRHCLVVGAGGAARAVVAGLADAGAAEVVVVNRTLRRAVAAAALAGPAGRVGHEVDAVTSDLVVNATPLGMGDADDPDDPDDPDGHGTSWPVAPEHLHAGQLVVDLVYHPRVTSWMDAARSRGARVANGVGMLVHQAALQLESWTGLEVPVEAMWEAVSGPGGAGA